MQYRRRPGQYGGFSGRGLAQWVSIAVLIIVTVVLRQFSGEGGKGVTSAANGALEGVARLVDGDSFHMDSNEVRLQGIDAPEGRQMCRRNGTDWACGADARRKLASLIGNSTVVCRTAGRDQHSRYLGFCKAGGRDLNAEMVSSGFAVGFGAYVREEGEAKAAKRGLWSSEFERPQAWRRKNMRSSADGSGH